MAIYFVDTYVDVIYGDLLWECFQTSFDVIFNDIIEILDENGILIDVLYEATKRYNKRCENFRKKQLTAD